MPAATTHYEFAKDVYLNLPNDIVDQITNLHMFYLGSQGPDLFFFNKGGISKSSLNTYGNMLHNQKISEVIKYLFEHSQDDLDLLSYTYGYLCHYALDSLAHPLVYYMSRYGIEKLESENIKHFRIEAMIDREVLKSKDRDITSYDVYRALTVSKCDNVKLANLYHNLFKDLFDVELSFNQLQQTIKDCPFYLKLLKPSNLKFKLFSQIEKTIKIDHFASGLMLNNQLSEDVLNLKNQPWYNIFAPEITSNKSFFELYDEAIVKAEKLISDPKNLKYQQSTFDGKPFNID
ncbi:MAG: zinc dependent phospholipase C family protein [Erysipelotrichaceae bacterium]|nr:zinc dependent phospholipase C family protein [Erysipelotrichaceae bacterium]MDY5252034.1 zinc dependent phospholipase C family protein [Erysipelotrichaceae bacterium]